MNIDRQRRTALSIDILRTLHRDGGRVGGSALARRVGTTPGYLPQIVAALVRRGWVESERGPNGGYSITTEGSAVSVLELLDATEGRHRLNRCALRDATCPGDDQCPVHAVWAQARAVLVEGLANTPAVGAPGGSS